MKRPENDYGAGDVPTTKREVSGEREIVKQYRLLLLQASNISDPYNQHVVVFHQLLMQNESEGSIRSAQAEVMAS